MLSNTACLNETELLRIVRHFLAELDRSFANIEVSLHFSLQHHLGIDSIGRAELFHRIERAYNVQLPDRLLSDAKTLNDVFQAIQTATPYVTPIKMREHRIEQTPTSSIDVSNAATLLDVLIMHAQATPDRPHVYLQDETGKEDIISYGQLLDNALKMAFSLKKRGLEPGETIAIMLPTSAEFFYSFFGILFAGCIPVPIYPPLRLNQLETYVQHEAKILQNANARLLISFQKAETLNRLLRGLIPSLQDVVTANELIGTEKIFPESIKANDIALIQYTSGSTSSPKGVLLTHYNLLSNIRAYGKAIAVSPEDKVVSWLPLYHDLGLIGNWLGSVYFGTHLIAMSPLTFLNHPEKWLWAIHYHRATISAGPNFAYELCVNKINPSIIEGLDLSSWRIAVNGAESINPKTLERFTQKFSSYGFKAETLLPVYGLAETSLGLSTPPLGRKPWVDVIDRQIFENEHRAQSVENNSNKETLQIVSCGVPLAGHDVRIVNHRDEELPERFVGHLQFKGPSCMQCYYNNPSATAEAYHDGWWDSGDFAYRVNNELFITGRKKDVIIKAGRNLYPNEIEELTSSIAGVRRGCVIAFGVQDTKKGTENLVIVAESQEKNPPSKITEEIIRLISVTLNVTPDHVVLVPPRTIPKTSSGKLQRSACKKMYLENQLGKKSLPVWMQLSKLSAQWLAATIKRNFITLSQWLFTAYLGTLLLSTFLIAFLGIVMTPRKIAVKIFHLWAKIFAALSFCPLIVKNKNNLPTTKPVIYVTNHASYIDALVLTIILSPNVRMVGKKELFKVPILRTIMKKFDHIAIDKNNAAQGVDDAKYIEDAINAGHSVLIFPEGTFSYAKGLRPFKLGAFKIAAKLKTPICPVAIQGTRYIFRGNKIIFSYHPVEVTIGELLQPTVNDWQEILRLKNAARTFIAEHCGEPSLDHIIPGKSNKKKSD